MDTVKYIEHEIDSETHKHIEILRNECFPDEQKIRSYGIQIPHFRFLTYNGFDLVGHLGIDHRMMSFNHKPYSVFGIIDLCVCAKYRNQGIGKSLLADVESLAKTHNIDCMVLLAGDFRLYEDAGFTSINSTCQWLHIIEYANYGVAVEHIKGELLIKPLSENFIAKGPVDFLGYMF